MRDARPFLQIAHVGAWQTASESALARARRAAFVSKDYPSEPARHDPTAVLALRQWLEAVTLRDAVGRKLPTWLIETGARSAHGDDESFALARTMARAVAQGTSTARLAIAGRQDVRGASTLALDARFGATHPAPPLVQRAPHGGFEVQLYSQDTERCDDALGHARTSALRDEFSPADRAPVLVLSAGFDHDATARRCGDGARWVLSTEGSTDSVGPTVGAIPRDASATQSVVLLRVYASQSQRRAALIERLWFSRPLAMGGFRLVSSRTDERLVTLNRGEEP
ncbi:MAG: hypothetical protein JNK05_34250 [Myxococcales bacterium]|nr:hypothetical protein [Myxococcales bacterium]